MRRYPFIKMEAQESRTPFLDEIFGGIYLAKTSTAALAMSKVDLSTFSTLIGNFLQLYYPFQGFWLLGLFQ